MVERVLQRRRKVTMATRTVQLIVVTTITVTRPILGKRNSLQISGMRAIKNEWKSGPLQKGTAFFVD